MPTGDEPSARPANREQYRDLLDAVRAIIVAQLKLVGVEHLVEARVKSAESIEEKIGRKGYSAAADELTDIAGLRIITASIDDVSEVERCVRSEFEVDPNHSRDHGAALRPDEFGYRASHFVVRLNEARRGQVEHRDYADLFTEIQVRTVFQDAWAKASHFLLYKKDEAPDSIQRRLNALAGLSEVGDRELTALRDAIENGIAEARKAVRRDAPVPLTAESISAYSLSSPRMKWWHDVLSELDVSTTDPDHLAMTLGIVEKLSFSSTSDLDNALDAARPWGPDFLGRWIAAVTEASPSLEGRFSIAANDVIIYVLVAAHPEVFTTEVLIDEFGWRLEPTTVVLRAAQEARKG